MAGLQVSSGHAEYLAENKGGQLVAISAAFAILTTLVLGSRFYAKRFQGGGFFLDDAFILLAYIFNLGMCAIGIVMTKVGGVGRHVTFIEEQQPKALSGWAQCIFAFELVYFTSVALPKLSILCLYLRIFNWKGSMRLAAWMIFTITAMTSVSLFVAACFQCRPLAFWWDKTIKGGSCFDIQLFFHVQSLPGFILDLAIMALPLKTIWNLKLPLIKRLALVGVFVIASFGIVASIIRATIFFDTAALEDRTFASVDLVGWSITETSVYIITGCLPNMKPFISHYMPKWLKNAVRRTMTTLKTVSRRKGGSGYLNSKSVGNNETGNNRQPAANDDTIELTSRGKGSDSTRSALSPVYDGSFLNLSPEIRSGGLTNGFERERSGDLPASGQIKVTKEIKVTRL